jgi:hypothetical protein
VFADAMEAGKRPIVAPGVLLERTRTKDGHTYREWHGSPPSWMAAHAPIGQDVTGFGSFKP